MDTSNRKVAVIATCAISRNKNFNEASKARAGTEDLNKVSKGTLDKASTILCSNSHRSYRAFAEAKAIEQKKLNASKG